MGVICIELHRLYLCKEQRRCEVKMGIPGTEPLLNGETEYVRGMWEYNPGFLRRGLASNSVGHFNFSQQGKQWQQNKKL